jgi:serine/threonine protein kinase
MEEDLVKLLADGKLEERGLRSEDELKTIVDLFKRDGNVRAAKFLVSQLNTQDKNPAVTPFQISQAIASKENGCIEKMLKMGMDGTLSLHNDIKKSQIKTGDIIGKGKAGTVYQGTWNGKEVAIKCFNNSDKIDDKEFQKELSIMSLLHEPRLVLPCYGGSAKKGEKFIVSELMETSLYDLVHDKGFQMPEPLCYLIALAVAKCVQYLHSCDIIHRDLKSLNLLVNKDFETKICDFGLSRVIDHTTQMTGNIGTVAWVAPEIFSDKKMYSEKADVYSFAVICWELLARKLPFEESESFSIPLLVLKGKRPPLPKEGPKEYLKLIKKCWEQKPEKRPAFPAIVTALSEAIRKPPKGSKGATDAPLELKGYYAIEKKGNGYSLVTLSK